MRKEKELILDKEQIVYYDGRSGFEFMIFRFKLADEASDPKYVPSWDKFVDVDTTHFTGSILDSDGVRYHLKNGVLNRKDAPAIELQDGWIYFKDGLIHNDTGPAMYRELEYDCYGSHYSYYLEGEHMSRNDYFACQKDTKYWKHIVAGILGDNDKY